MLICLLGLRWSLKVWVSIGGGRLWVLSSVKVILWWMKVIKPPPVMLSLDFAMVV